MKRKSKPAAYRGIPADFRILRLAEIMRAGDRYRTPNGWSDIEDDDTYAGAPVALGMLVIRRNEQEAA